MAALKTEIDDDDTLGMAMALSFQWGSKKKAASQQHLRICLKMQAHQQNRQPQTIRLVLSLNTHFVSEKSLKKLVE